MKRKKKVIIFFDIDDTLFDSTRFRRIVRQKSLRDLNKSLKEYGYDFEDDYLFELFEIIYQEDKNAGDMYDKLLERLGVNLNEISMHVAVAVKSWDDTKKKMKAFPNVCTVLDKLQKKGYVLGIISSGLGVKQWDKLVRIGVHKYFHPKYVFITAETNGERRKYEKDRIFYSTIINHFHHERFDEFVMIGDKFLQDIIPAKEVGFRTIMFKSTYFKEEYVETAALLGCKIIENFKELLKIF